MTMSEIAALEARVARIEGIIEGIRDRLTSLENRLDRKLDHDAPRAGKALGTSGAMSLSDGNRQDRMGRSFKSTQTSIWASTDGWFRITVRVILFTWATTMLAILLWL
jgi:hypothetical protein